MNPWSDEPIPKHTGQTIKIRVETSGKDDESDIPFVDQFMHTQFPERFRMLTIEQYKETRDPKEYIRRFRNVMVQYTLNYWLICLTLQQTFGDLTFRWFGRLPSRSISIFSGFRKAFVRQFMRSVKRMKSLAHLSNLKQENNETLKKYLTRFGKEVAHVKDANDVAITAVFTNGLQSERLSFNPWRD
ncbi:hypothetical protein Dsin_018530 [Dipteronia sinensis]|uniref:Retrotransposon gag domain-containing protein n=1 Tax=Dipteronia sinensis TaxID=43782 RepID=A0AAE0A6A5_9ROSI|nr:hypothetical protein Dsin_018530 [Dipteronia sinensis]